MQVPPVDDEALVVVQRLFHLSLRQILPQILLSRDQEAEERINSRLSNVINEEKIQRMNSKSFRGT